MQPAGGAHPGEAPPVGEPPPPGDAFGLVHAARRAGGVCSPARAKYALNGRLDLDDEKINKN